MIGRLTLRAPHRSGETLTGYVGRLAARNGVDTLRFAGEVGIDWLGLTVGRSAPIEGLAALVGMAVDPLRDAAFRKADGWWWGNERIARSRLTRTRPRVCPLCLASDVGTGGGHAANAWQRAAWCLPSVLTCPTHDVELVGVGPITGPGTPTDFAGSLGTTLSRLDGLVATSIPRRPSALQDHLLARKGGAVSSPWLDAMRFDVVAGLSRLLGRVALWGPAAHGTDVTSTGDLHAADDAGFVVVQGGEAGIVDMLEHHLRTLERTPARTNHRSIFPALLRVIDREKVAVDYGWVRDIVGRYVTAKVPLPPGDYLGVRLERRRLHTVASAASQAKMDEAMLKGVLVNEGLIGPEVAHLTCGSIVLDAERHEALLNDLAIRLSAQDAASRLGLQPARFVDWVEAGLIRPFLTRGGPRRTLDLFRSTEVDALLARLTGDALASADAPRGLVGISDACRIAACDMVTLVRLVLDRRLRTVIRLPGLPGCRSLLVDPDEVRRHVVPVEQHGLSLTEVRDRWGMSWGMVKCLRDEGILEPLRDVSLNGASVLHYDARHLDAFLEQHVSLRSMARELGTAEWALRQRADDAGMRPVFDPYVRQVAIYRRTDLEALRRPTEPGNLRHAHSGPDTAPGRVGRGRVASQCGA